MITKREIAISVFKKHYKKASKTEADLVVLHHMGYCIDAMLEHGRNEVDPYQEFFEEVYELTKEIDSIMFDKGLSLAEVLRSVKQLKEENEKLKETKDAGTKH